MEVAKRKRSERSTKAVSSAAKKGDLIHQMMVRSVKSEIGTFLKQRKLFPGNYREDVSLS